MGPVSCNALTSWRTAHDDFEHFGAEKTLQRLCSTYWFPNIRQYVDRYISCCLCCLFNKRPIGRKEGFLHPIPKDTIPLKTIHDNYLGPFPKSIHRNEYIVVIVDAFTKFIFLCAVKLTRIWFVLEFFQELFAVYSIAEIIVTNQASCFTSKDMQKFCHRYNIHHTLVALAIPCANGQVEWLNRSILSALLTSTSEETHWNGNIHTVQFAINNPPNESTGRTSSELLFGYTSRGVPTFCWKTKFVESLLSCLIHKLNEKK